MRIVVNQARYSSMENLNIETFFLPTPIEFCETRIGHDIEILLLPFRQFPRLYLDISSFKMNF